MKITSAQLKKIIKEEVSKLIRESYDDNELRNKVQALYNKNGMSVVRDSSGAFHPEAEKFIAKISGLSPQEQEEHLKGLDEELKAVLLWMKMQ